MSGTLSAAERIANDLSVQSEIIEPSVVDGGGVASAEASATGNQGINQEAELVFSRAHGDGQEFSGTLEQAMKVCPALGSMSVEKARETLQQEELAARVIQRGKEKRQAETVNAVESKARSKESVSAEKNSQKVHDEQIEHQDDTSSIAETTPAASQIEQMPEAARRIAVLPEAVITTSQSKAPNNHLPDAAMPDLFLRQAEAARLWQVTNEIHDGRAADGSQRSSGTPLGEGSETDRRTQEVTRRPAESIAETIIVSATDQEAAHPVLIDEVSGFDAAQFDAMVDIREKLFPEHFVNYGEETELPISLEEPFFEPEAVVALVGVEPAHLAQAKTEEAKSYEQGEDLADYGLLGEDEVVLLIADLEQSKADVDEVGYPVLAEFFAADPLDVEVFRLSPAESRPVISVPELPAPVKEIETAITQLVEALDLAEVDETQKDHKILEEIITLPDALEAGTGTTEKEVEQKLEELFISLFEETGIEHTPDLVESFVKLTQAHYLKELLPIAIETEDNSQTLPDEIGTREFMQKLQHGLSAMKRAVTHFYEIGKSVMRLYVSGGNTQQFVAV